MHVYAMNGWYKMKGGGGKEKIYTRVLLHLKFNYLNNVK